MWPGRNVRLAPSGNSQCRKRDDLDISMTNHGESHLKAPNVVILEEINVSWAMSAVNCDSKLFGFGLLFDKPMQSSSISAKIGEDAEDNDFRDSKINDIEHAESKE